MIAAVSSPDNLPMVLMCFAGVTFWEELVWCCLYIVAGEVCMHPLLSPCAILTLSLPARSIRVPFGIQPVGSPWGPHAWEVAHCSSTMNGTECGCLMPGAISSAIGGELLGINPALPFLGHAIALFIGEIFQVPRFKILLGVCQCRRLTASASQDRLLH